jgi:murein DD-endopeptidase MepM/ murein hydrolase activator NlpD
MENLEGKQGYANIMKQIIYLFIGLLLFAFVAAADIYKYQDENGRWHYTDKSTASKNAETVNYKKTKEQETLFHLFTQTENDQHWLMAENKFYAPVQLSIKKTKNELVSQDWIIPPRSAQRILQAEKSNNEFSYAWFLGDHKQNPSAQEYALPIDVSLCPQISQSFNGRFSHQHIQSQYAVDVAANVGTDIKAARAGVVVNVKDDYALGGVDNFFLDKANFIQVFHDDSTWALYAHILLGSAAVKVGDRVKVGDVLAKSGSSGYSSGPHLHFVIQRNVGLKAESIPFQFKAPSGNLFTPKFAQKLCEI